MKPKKPEEILWAARQAKGWTQTEMAENLSIALNQSYSTRQYQRLEDGQFPKFKRQVIEAIDKLLGLSLCDMIYDTSVPHDTLLEEPKSEFTGSLNEIEVGSKPVHRDYLSSRRAKKINGGPVMVPLVPIAAQAGYAKHCYDMAYIEKLETYPILPGVDPLGASWRYFQVQGESMRETLKDGQYILTSQVIREDWRNVETSYIYVIITSEGVIVKRLYKVKGKDYWAAISDNEDEKNYPQFRVYVKDVLELWKFRRKVDWDAPSPRKVEIKV